MLTPRSMKERSEAAQRLALDPEPLQPIRELTNVSGLSPQALERWIRSGRSGVYLDGVNDPLRGWCSTVSAVRRAHRQRAEVLAQKGGAV